MTTPENTIKCNAVHSPQLKYTSNGRPPLALLRRSQSVLARSVVLLATLLSVMYLPYILFAILNRHFRWIDSIFLCYAGSEKYARHYTFDWAESFMRWVPVPIGFFEQGGRWGLVFGSPVIEKRFTDKANEARLKSLIGRINRIARIIGAKQVNYAGILPSYLSKQAGFNIEAQNAKPAWVVFRAYQMLTQQQYNREVPVILVGGAGSVGRQIQTHLKVHSISFEIVDPAAGQAEIPSDWRGKELILIDVARKGVLENYVDYLWPGLTILNETFPEPPQKLVSQLLSQGVAVFHLAGVVGRCVPSLPHGYSKSIPCCAIHADVKDSIPVLRDLAEKI